MAAKNLKFSSDVEDVYPLSPMQEGMLFDTLYNSASNAGFGQFRAELRLGSSGMNADAIRRAWEHVIDRHSILRTSFLFQRVKQPVQVVHRRVNLPIEKHDWSRLDAAERQRRMQELLAADRQRGFDLTKPLLMRLTLIRTSDDAWELLWSYHHLLMDGWSQSLLIDEVLKTYHMLCQGGELEVKPATPFRAYISWLQRQDRSRAEAFWRSTLKGFVGQPRLVPFPVESEGESRYARQFINPSEQATAELYAFSRRYRLTINTLLQGAWAILLSRYTGCEDIVFGATTSGRPSDLPGSCEMIGLFINTLPARVHVSPESSLVDWLQAIQRNQAEAREYDYRSLAEVQRWSEAPSGEPLFESILVFENYPASHASDNSAVSATLVDSIEATNYPLTVIAALNPQLLIEIRYYTGQFSDTAIRRMLGHLEVLLEGINANPEQRLSDLPLLTEAERSRLLAEWNGARRPYHGEACIHHLFGQQVDRTPGAIALSFSGQVLTYRELDERSNQLAHYLRARGVAAETVVGIMIERSIELVVGILGILKAGGAYLPLDLSYLGEHLSFMLQDTPFRLLLTQGHFPKRLSICADRLILLDRDWKEIAACPRTAPEVETTAENLAYVLYSSDKCVMVEHRGIQNRLDWLQKKLNLGQSDVMLQRSPFAVDTSVLEIFWPLLSGSQLVIVDSKAESDLDEIWRTIVRQEISIAHFLPSELAALEELGGTEYAKRASKLRAVLCSGEPLRRSIAQSFLRSFEGDLYYMIGYPETATEVTLCNCKSDKLKDGLAFYDPTSLPVYILDQHLQPAPVNMPGDVYIVGDCLARGYLKDRAETARNFRDNPFGDLPGKKMFRTGDVGIRLEDGTIRLVTRADRQCWIKGFRFDLGEIEAVLLREPSVEDAAVVVRVTNASQQRIVAYIVSAHPFSPERLRAHLEALLPRFMVPDAFVAVSNIPLTAGGKVDEKTLSQFAVIDFDLVRRGEDQFRSVARCDKIAIVVRDYNVLAPALHLSDLLPDWKQPPAGNHQESVATLQSQPDLKNESTQKKLAISYGESLRTEVDLPATLAEALGRAARANGKGIIYVQRDGSEAFQPYSGLLEEAERILTGLRKLGGQPGDKVIFQFDRNEDFIAAFWGCMLAGMVPMPINVALSYDQANSTTNKLRNSWQMLGKPLVLSSAKLAPEVRTLSRVLRLDDFRVEAIDELRKLEPSKNWHSSRPDNAAVILLTSGSTGLPRGVVQSHRAILTMSASASQMNGFSADDISLNWFPLDHVGGIVMSNIRDIFLTCQQIHAPTPAILQQPLTWLDLIDRHRVTITWAPNFAYGLINAHADEIQEGRWDLSSMRFLLNGGEAIVARTVRRFMSLLARCGLPATAMRPLWGMSETSSAVTFSDRFSLEATSDKDSFVEVGLPIPGFSMRIVDNDDRLVEEGVEGRLQVKGPTVTSGYYNNPALNQEVFTEDGWFNTGDLGLLRQGRLTISGRQKDVIIINGVNFYSHEIEAVVDEVAGVEVSFTAACATREPESETDRLIVFFSPIVSDDEGLTRILKEIREKVIREIGVNPARLIPVEKSAIPKTEIGKIQRAQLRQRFEAGEFDRLLKRVDILSGNEQTLPNWFYTRVWRPREICISSVRPAPGPYLIFLDRAGLGERLGAELDRFETSYVMVEPATEFRRSSITRYDIKPDDPEHYRRLMDSLSDDGIHISQILHLWTYSDQVASVTNREQLEQAQILGIYSLSFLAQALAGRRAAGSSFQLQVISRNSQAVLPSDELGYANAPVLGMIRTMAAEMPWLQCRHIDLSSDDLKTLVDHIIRETRVGRKDQEVAYRNGRRLIARLQAVDWQADRAEALPFKKGGLYLLSGGLGGLGVQIGKYLLKNYQAKLLLIGRTVLPARSEWNDHLQAGDEFADKIRALQSLEEAGGEIIYDVADVTNLERLRQLTERACARWQCDLDGVIHLAGIFREGLIIDETRESLAAVIDAKLVGTWALDRLLTETAGDLFIIFSSVNGFFGGVGAGAYAAANAFQDCFSAYQSRKGRVRSHCLAWSMWDDIGMSRNYEKKDATRARGYHIIPLDKGLLSFLVALRHRQQSLLIGLNCSNPHIRSYVEAQPYQAQALSAFFLSGLDQPTVERLKQSVIEDIFQVPINCDFIEIGEMPIATGGEIDREHLAALANISRRTSVDRITPRTDLEMQVTGIWQSVLGVSSPGIHDNFFELGGHSILATQVISRINEAFKIELSLRHLFEAPTIAALAQRLEQRQTVCPGMNPPPLRRRSRTESSPLSFAQQRLWFIDQLEPGTSVYNIPGAVKLEGCLNLETLERVINEIVRRHEALRTRIEADEGEPIQVIDEWEQRRLEVEDLTGLVREVREEEIHRIAREEAGLGFDLRRGPLLRVKALKLEEDEHVVLFTMHHIVSDAWSMGVLAQEICALYKAMSEGQESPLPELEIQYADYAVWEREWLQGGVLEQQISYWKRQLKGGPTAFALPTDRPRPSVRSYRGSQKSLTLSAELTARIKELSLHQNVTLFMSLLAAFQTLLYRYSWQENFLIGTSVANRIRRETEHLIGFFVNMLALRADLSDNPTFTELLARVREVVLGAFAHQDLPFDFLVKDLQLERDPSRMPLIQVFFVLQSALPLKLELPGLEVAPLVIESGTTPFDITMSLIETPHGLVGTLDYNADIFEPATILKLLQHYAAILEAMVAYPEWRVLDVPLHLEDGNDVAPSSDLQRKSISNTLTTEKFAF
jgi:amino acid adenylation domain-containing protein